MAVFPGPDGDWDREREARLGLFLGGVSGGSVLEFGSDSESESEV